MYNYGTKPGPPSMCLYSIAIGIFHAKLRRDTCLGTEADLTAALRKSLPASALGVAVDSPLATIVTAFVVIFNAKFCGKGQT